jgi:sulfite exporter TauE/SafE
MNEALPLLAAAFVTGVLGSAHCFGMCAGLSGLFAVNASVASLRLQIPMAFAYNAGRILSYAFLGILVASVGQTVVSAIPNIAVPVRLASGLLIVIVGLQVAFDKRFLAPVEKAGARLWNRIAPAAKSLLPVTSLPKALGLGLLWGWLPCGLVYSVLLLAATTANAANGGLVMIAFGIGTMPAMIMTGISASSLARFMSRKRVSAGLLIVLIGVLTLAVPVMKLSGNMEKGTHSEHTM